MDANSDDFQCQYSIPIYLFEVSGKNEDLEAPIYLATAPHLCYLDDKLKSILKTTV